MYNYYEFIICLAFETILLYEGKRELSFEQLHNYRIKLCKKIKDTIHSYLNEEEKETLEEAIKQNLEMSDEEEKELLLDFINAHPDFFSHCDGVISLNEDITIEELEELKFDLEPEHTKTDITIYRELISSSACPACLIVLECTKMKKEVNHILEIEEMIESAYQTYQYTDSQNIIRLASLLVASQILRICKQPTYIIDCYINVIINMESIPEHHLISQQ